PSPLERCPGSPSPRCGSDDCRAAGYGGSLDAYHAHRRSAAPAVLRTRPPDTLLRLAEAAPHGEGSRDMTYVDVASLAKLDIEAGRAVHILHPKQIAAFRGHPRGRKDQLLRIGDMYRKKKWLESVIEGPAEVWLGVPRGFVYSTLNVEEDSSLLFLFRNVLHY